MSAPPVPQSEPAAPRSDAQQALTREQQQVVLAPARPLLVLAGAGSGKTRTLVHRVARLLTEEGAAGRAPRVLLMTFTQAAAAEMVQRTAALLGRALQTAQQLSPQAQREPLVWAGTFHHIAARCLRCHGAQLGLPADFGVLSPADAVVLLRQGLQGAALSAAGRLALAPLVGRRPERVLGLFSRAVNSEAPLAEVVQRRAPELAALVPALAALCDAYTQRKLALRRLDFDDLLLLWRLLLCDVPEVARALQESFDHVLVDEFQDVSPLQAQIVRSLCAQHRSLTAVGDPAQAIYGFRGADAAQLARFLDDYPDGQVLRLTWNHRSVAEVVALANRVMAASRRPQLVLRAVPPREGAKAPDPPQWVQVASEAAQAAWVAQQARALVAGGRAPDELVVLYRNHAHGRALPAALQAAGLPCVVRAGKGSDAHGQQREEALWHLRLLVNDDDALARERLLGAYRAALGAGSAAAHEALARQLERLRTRLSDWERGPTGGASGLVGRLCEGLARGEFGALRPGAAGASGDSAGWRALAGELVGSLSLLEDSRSGLEVLREVLLAAALAGDEGRAAEAVTLSTVHRAKGLEWPVVFVVGLSEGHFPSLRAGSDLQEERNLFYVAVTRARHLLYLVTPTGGAGGAPLRPSRYLRDLRPET